jgi:mRNA interferase HigB
MRIIARRTLREFVQSRMGHRGQPAAKAALDASFDEVKRARWRNTAEVKQSYATRVS